MKKEQQLLDEQRRRDKEKKELAIKKQKVIEEKKKQDEEKKKEIEDLRNLINEVVVQTNEQKKIAQEKYREWTNAENKYSEFFFMIYPSSGSVKQQFTLNILPSNLNFGIF